MIADITPNGTATAVSTGSAPPLATWIQFTAPSTNSADVRVGDSNVGAGRGATIAKGTSLIFPRLDFDQQRYDLTTIYVYGASGSDKVAITYLP